MKCRGEEPPIAREPGRAGDLCGGRRRPPCPGGIPEDYKRIAIQEPVELMSLVGKIAQDDQGDPKLHAHVVVGKSDGSAHGGHLLQAYVRPTLEVVVIEASQHLRRTMRGDLGLALLDLSS